MATKPSTGGVYTSAKGYNAVMNDPTIAAGFGPDAQEEQAPEAEMAAEQQEAPAATAVKPAAAPVGLAQKTAAINKPVSEYGRLVMNGQTYDIDDDLYAQMLAGNKSERNRVSGNLRNAIDLARQKGNTAYYDSNTNLLKVLDANGNTIYDEQGSWGTRNGANAFFGKVLGTYRNDYNVAQHDLFNGLRFKQPTTFNTEDQISYNELGDDNIPIVRIMQRDAKGNIVKGADGKPVYTVDSMDMNSVLAGDRLRAIKEYAMDPNSWRSYNKFKNSLWGKYLDSAEMQKEYDAAGGIDTFWDNLTEKALNGTLSDHEERILKALNITYAGSDTDNKAWTDQQSRETAAAAEAAARSEHSPAGTYSVGGNNFGIKDGKLYILNGDGTIGDEARIFDPKKNYYSFWYGGSSTFAGNGRTYYDALTRTLMGRDGHDIIGYGYIDNNGQVQYDYLDRTYDDNHKSVYNMKNAADVVKQLNIADNEWGSDKMYSRIADTWSAGNDGAVNSYTVDSINASGDDNDPNLVQRHNDGSFHFGMAQDENGKTILQHRIPDSLAEDKKLAEKGFWVKKDESGKVTYNADFKDLYKAHQNLRNILKNATDGKSYVSRERLEAAYKKFEEEYNKVISGKAKTTTTTTGTAPAGQVLPRAMTENTEAKNQTYAQFNIPAGYRYKNGGVLYAEKGTSLEDYNGYVASSPTREIKVDNRVAVDPKLQKTINWLRGAGAATAGVGAVVGLGGASTLGAGSIIGEVGDTGILIADLLDPNVSAKKALTTFGVGTALNFAALVPGFSAAKLGKTAKAAEGAIKGGKAAMEAGKAADGVLTATKAYDTTKDIAMLGKFGKRASAADAAALGIKEGSVIYESADIIKEAKTIGAGLSKSASLNGAMKAERGIAEAGKAITTAATTAEDSVKLVDAAREATTAVKAVDAAKAAGKTGEELAALEKTAADALKKLHTLAPNENVITKSAAELEALYQKAFVKSQDALGTVLENVTKAGAVVDKAAGALNEAGSLNALHKVGAFTKGVAATTMRTAGAVAPIAIGKGAYDTYNAVKEEGWTGENISRAMMVGAGALSVASNITRGVRGIPSKTEASHSKAITVTNADGTTTQKTLDLSHLEGKGWRSAKKSGQAAYKEAGGDEAAFDLNDFGFRKAGFKAKSVTSGGVNPSSILQASFTNNPTSNNHFAPDLPAGMVAAFDASDWKNNPKYRKFNWTDYSVYKEGGQLPIPMARGGLSFKNLNIALGYNDPEVGHTLQDYRNAVANAKKAQDDWSTRASIYGDNTDFAGMLADYDAAAAKIGNNFGLLGEYAQKYKNFDELSKNDEDYAKVFGHTYDATSRAEDIKAWDDYIYSKRDFENKYGKGTWGRDYAADSKAFNAYNALGDNKDFDYTSYSNALSGINNRHLGDDRRLNKAYFEYQGVGENIDDSSTYNPIWLDERAGHALGKHYDDLTYEAVTDGNRRAAEVVNSVTRNHAPYRRLDLSPLAHAQERLDEAIKNVSLGTHSSDAGLNYARDLDLLRQKRESDAELNAQESDGINQNYATNDQIRATKDAGDFELASKRAATDAQRISADTTALATNINDKSTKDNTLLNVHKQYFREDEQKRLYGAQLALNAAVKSGDAETIEKAYAAYTPSTVLNYDRLKNLRKYI